MKPTIPQIVITNEALAKMKKLSRKKKQVETGGMLLGGRFESATGPVVFITKVTGAGPKAQQRKHSFQPDLAYYKRVRKQNGSLCYLGEWHRHPENCQGWSEYDLVQAQKILRQEDHEELICPISYFRAQGKERSLQIQFYYINRALGTLLPVSYSVTSSPLQQERKIDHLVLEEELAEKFWQSQQPSQLVAGDFYASDQLLHIFSTLQQENSQVLLVNSQQLRELEFSGEIDAVVILTKEEQKIAAKAFVVSQGRSRKVPVELVSLYGDQLARNRSLWETGALKDKHVAIIGVGSIGSVAALELARAGVGKFTLIDSDRVVIENLCRHVCDISELGMEKTVAVARRIKKIMPGAIVNTYTADTNADPDQTLKNCQRSDILLVATDTESSRSLCNWIAQHLNIPTIFAGLLQRAIGGRVWRMVPGKTACYECHTHWKGLEQRGNVAYSEVESIRDLTVQPGLGNDIAFITHLAVRYVIATLREPDKKLLSTLPYNLVFWFNYQEDNWGTQPLTLYQIEDLEPVANCQGHNKLKE